MGGPIGETPEGPPTSPGNGVCHTVHGNVRETIKGSRGVERIPKMEMVEGIETVLSWSSNQIHIPESVAEWVPMREASSSLARSEQVGSERTHALLSGYLVGILERFRSKHLRNI